MGLNELRKLNALIIEFALQGEVQLVTTLITLAKSEFTDYSSAWKDYDSILCVTKKIAFYAESNQNYSDFLQTAKVVAKNMK